MFGGFSETFQRVKSLEQSAVTRLRTLFWGVIKQNKTHIDHPEEHCELQISSNIHFCFVFLTTNPARQLTASELLEFIQGVEIFLHILNPDSFL